MFCIAIQIYVPGKSFNFPLDNIAESSVSVDSLEIFQSHAKRMKFLRFPKEKSLVILKKLSRLEMIARWHRNKTAILPEVPT
jgi:hypothetical protein